MDCYTWWQIATEVHIMLSLVPVFLFIAFAPFCVEKKSMSVKMFTIGCLMPVPVMLVFCLQKIFAKLKTAKSADVVQTPESEVSSVSEHTVMSEQNQIHRAPSNVLWNLNFFHFFSGLTIDSDRVSELSRDTLGKARVSSDSDTDIGSEYSLEMIKVAGKASKSSEESVSQKLESNKNPLETSKQENINKFCNCRESITYTLLKHYRPLTLFGFQFTWLGIHKLYRVGLVACYTYITDPLIKLTSMSLLLLTMSVCSAMCKPYVHKTANNVAMLSYAANICISMINLMRTIFLIYGCDVNCTIHKKTALWWLGNFEDMLLMYIPIGVVLLVLLYKEMQRKEQEGMKETTRTEVRNPT